MPSVARSGQLVLVEWADAHADSGWTSVSELSTKPEKVMSVGWVVKHDERGITIAGDRGTNHRKRMKASGQVNRPLTVPAGMILHVWEIHI